MPTAESSPPPLLIDRRTAARMLAICPRTIDAMARRGELPAVRIGRAVRFDCRDIEKFIEQAKTSATEVSRG